MAHARLGRSEGQAGSDAPDLLRDYITPEIMTSLVAGVSSVDVTDLLPHVQSPTLVLHRGQAHVGPEVSVARSLTSQIPDARLIVLEGTSVAPYLGDSQAVLRAVEEFLGTSELLPASKVGTSEKDQTLVEPLSDRELEVLRLIAAGGSNWEIAQDLFIAVGTVKTHLNKIYGKLEVHSRTQALVRARELNML